MPMRMTNQPHLEYRPSGFHWRRRRPRIAPGQKKFEKVFLLFSLRTHVLLDAKELARKLTLLSDVAFAGLSEKTMPIGPETITKILTELCRFQIEAADLAREVAPQRTLEAATYEEACAAAALGTLRQAIALLDRSATREPLRQVAARLGIALDEEDLDYQRLAMCALQAMIEAGEENIRRDRGEFGGQPLYLDAALASPRQPQLSPSCGIQAPPIAMSVATPAVSAQTPEAGTPQAPAALSNPPLQGDVANPSVRREPEAPLPPTTARVIPEAIKADRKPERPTTTILEGSSWYIEARKQGFSTFKPNEQRNEKGGMSWQKNSAGNVRSTARLMAGILGDISFSDITDQDLKSAFELMTRLPSNYGRSSKENRTPQQAADEADATEMQNAEVTRQRMKRLGASAAKIEWQIHLGRIDRFRVNTIYRHMQDFQRICKFLVIKGYLDHNIMEDHIWSSAEKTRRDLLQEDNARETWDGHLDAFFRTPIFQEKLDDPGDPLFWAPLISLHGGLRSEEVLQLSPDDICETAGIPCFDLKQGPG